MPIEFDVRQGAIVLNTQQEPPTKWLVIEVPLNTEMPNGVIVAPFGKNDNGQDVVLEQEGTLHGQNMLPTMEHLTTPQMIAGRRRALFATEHAAQPDLNTDTVLHNIEPDTQAFIERLSTAPKGPKTLRRETV